MPVPRPPQTALTHGEHFSPEPPSQPQSFSMSLPEGSPDVWNHLTERLPFSLDLPFDPAIQDLVSLPLARLLTFTSSTPHIPEDLNTKQLAGLLIHITGEENHHACTECRRHAQSSPLKGCISATKSMAANVAPLLGYAAHAWGNCNVRKTASQ